MSAPTGPRENASEEQDDGRTPVLTYHCPECDSNGFEPSITGVGCTFCDGTEGGNPPVLTEVSIGVAIKDSVLTQCSKCKGSGLTSAEYPEGRFIETCPKCGGSGSYHVAKIDINKPLGIEPPAMAAVWEKSITPTGDERCDLRFRELIPKTLKAIGPIEATKEFIPEDHPELASLGIPRMKTIIDKLIESGVIPKPTDVITWENSWGDPSNQRDLHLTKEQVERMTIEMSKYQNWEKPFLFAPIDWNTDPKPDVIVGGPDAPPEG